MTSSRESTTNFKPRILCVGMCVLDIVHVCAKYPEEDTDRRCLKGYWQRGGNASNNCTVLRNLNADCEFLGMISRSEAFQFLYNDCHKRGIRIDNCPSTAQDPPFSSVILSQETDSRTIIHSNSNFPILIYDQFKGIDLGQYSWVHFEGRNPEETMQMMNMICDFNRQKGRRIRISLELEKIKQELLVLTEFADLVFLGKELALSLNWADGQQAVYGLRKRCTKANEIICTWGSDGSYCLDSNSVCHKIRPYPPEQIVDALGAGDTFCAAVIYGLDHLQMSLKDAVILGNRAAGFKLGHYGYDELKNFDIHRNEKAK